MECLCGGPGRCAFLLTAPVLCLYGWVAPWKSIMHPFQHLKIMCTVAAEALDKQGNMSLIKISFISLLIKRLSFLIECLCPSHLGLSLLFSLSVPPLEPEGERVFYCVSVVQGNCKQCVTSVCSGTFQTITSNDTCQFLHFKLNVIYLTTPHSRRVDPPPEPRHTGWWMKSIRCDEV